MSYREPPCQHPGKKFVLDGVNYKDAEWNRKTPNRDRWFFSMRIKLFCEHCDSVMFRALHQRFAPYFDRHWADHGQCDVAAAPCPRLMGLWANEICDHDFEKIVDASDIEVRTNEPYTQALDGVYRCKICNYIYVQHMLSKVASPPFVEAWATTYLVSAVTVLLIQTAYYLLRVLY